MKKIRILQPSTDNRRYRCKNQIEYNLVSNPILRLPTGSIRLLRVTSRTIGQRLEADVPCILDVSGLISVNNYKLVLSMDSRSYKWRRLDRTY